MSRLVASALLASLLWQGICFADTVVLKNGRKLQGIIRSADEDAEITLEVGSGTLVLSRDEVAVVKRSGEGEHESLRSEWQIRRLRSEAAYNQGLAQERIRSEEEAKLEKLKAKPIALTSKTGGHLYVEASINDLPARMLMVDTGAPMVILSRATAEEVGIDFDVPRQHVTSSIGGHKIDGFIVQLDKVEVNGFWVRNIKTLVHTERGKSWAYNLDILGMSYFEHFHFELNAKKKILTLSWGEDT